MYKDPIPDDLKYFLVYKFTCASCSSSYIGKICSHFKSSIENNFKKDNKSHIFKHLHCTLTCFASYNLLCFEIIDKANSKLDLKIKEVLHINWRKPNLNVQQNHLGLSLSLQFPSPIVLFCLCFFVFFISLSSIIFIISDTNYLYFLLSKLHLAITSTDCNTHFIYYFHYLYANYRHFLLPQLHFVITSSHYNTPFNRFYNNYVINICLKQLLWFV